MSGHIISQGQISDTPHECEPGVVTSRRRQRHRVSRRDIGPGALWACDECNTVWKWDGSDWSRTLVVLTA